jgi:alpha-galactosidase
MWTASQHVSDLAGGKLPTKTPKDSSRTGCLWMRAGCALLLACATGVSLWAQQEQLARTPPMGWNSWYGFKCKASDVLLRAQADALVSSGMRDLGYVYVNVDDCWQGQRDAQGVIHSNANFPDMKALADYLHSQGLKFGIYTSPGPKTCAGYEGSYRHEDQDAETYAAWGVDFVKYDWCSAARVYKAGDMQTAYKKMYDALRRTGRPMVYSLCQYGMQRVWAWGGSVGGNMWRTTDDVGGDYTRMASFGFDQDGLERFAGPGHWNDPDMLQAGLGKFSDDEARTQMSLWCILAAPLLASNDLTKMTAETRAILMNPEVIAVDQDPAGIQGHRVAQEGPLEVWVKPLSDGSKAVGLFNRGESTMPVTAYFRDIEVGETATVRDLWRNKDLGTFTDRFTGQVPAHGAMLIKVKRRRERRRL